MFKTKTVPNPLRTADNGAALFVTTYVCVCGSEAVHRSYLHDFTGEVVGLRLTCHDCGQSENF